MLKFSHGSFITSYFRVSSATNYRVKKAIYTIWEQPPFFSHILSLSEALTHTRMSTQRWKTYINTPHIMQRHQLLVTPPKPAGKRVRREMVVGSLVEGGMWSFGRGCRGWVEEARVRKKCEGVRVVEENRHNNCFYQFCLQAFLRVEKLHWLTCHHLWF